MVDAINDIEESFNLEELFAELNVSEQTGVVGEDRLANLQSPSSSKPCQMTAIPLQETKEWHQHVDFDLRNFMIHKLVQRIFPDLNPQIMLDKRMQNLIAYVKKIESNIYLKANCKSEYYHLLAEEIYKNEKKLEAKLQKRKKEQ